MILNQLLLNGHIDKAIIIILVFDKIFKTISTLDFLAIFQE